MFRQDFTCPALLKDLCQLTRTGLSPATARLSRRFRFTSTEATGLVRARSPLLAESLLMSFPPGTEMFQFPGFASSGLYIQPKNDPIGPGFPIRKSADQRLLSPPHSLSQSATSFIASRCQGIHQMPFMTLAFHFYYPRKTTTQPLAKTRCRMLLSLCHVKTNADAQQLSLTPPPKRRPSSPSREAKSSRKSAPALLTTLPINHVTKPNRPLSDSELKGSQTSEIKTRPPVPCLSPPHSQEQSSQGNRATSQPYLRTPH